LTIKGTSFIGLIKTVLMIRIHQRVRITDKSYSRDNMNKQP